MKLPLLLAAVFLSALPAHAQENVPAPEPAPAPEKQGEEKPRRRRFVIGPQVGAFLPTSSKVRDHFGSSWLSIGPGLGAVKQPSYEGRFAFDFSFSSQKKNGNRAYILPLGVSYTKALLRDPERSAQPFVGAALNVVGTKLRSIPDGVDTGVKAGAGGSVFLGSTVGEKAFVEARYRTMTSVAGFNFSGLDLTAGYRF
jgi:hypothetical protein